MNAAEAILSAVALEAVDRVRVVYSSGRPAVTPTGTRGLVARGWWVLDASSWHRFGPYPELPEAHGFARSLVTYRRTRAEAS